MNLVWHEIPVLAGAQYRQMQLTLELPAELKGPLGTKVYFRWRFIPDFKNTGVDAILKRTFHKNVGEFGEFGTCLYNFTNNESVFDIPDLDAASEYAYDWLEKYITYLAEGLGMKVSAHQEPQPTTLDELQQQISAANMIKSLFKHAGETPGEEDK